MSLYPISRRSFLKSSLLAATVAPLILPRRLWGQTAPSNTINVGMIGMGRQAYYSNTPPFLNMKGVRVVAVCDVDSWRLEEGRKLVDAHYSSQPDATSSKTCAVYRDYRELLARTDIDAVMISTPDHSHVPIALDAVRAGKDICCEKPLTVTIAEGRLLSDAVRKAGRVFRTDTEFRSMGVNQLMCQAVLNGRIGKLHTIKTGVVRDNDSRVVPKAEPVPEELDYDLWLGTAPKAPYQQQRVHPRKVLSARPGWLRISDYGDGVISNWGTHVNDIAQWGNGTDDTGPVQVEAVGTFPKEGTLWDTLIDFKAHMVYANGVKLEFNMSRPFVRFEGDEGWVEIDGLTQALTASSEEIRRYRPGPNDIKLPLRSEKRDFIDCVRTRKRSLVDAEVGHRTNSISHLARISIALGGRRLKWDPERELFPEDPEANKLLSVAAFRMQK
jgi:predicted dehydrogenase